MRSGTFVLVTGLDGVERRGVVVWSNDVEVHVCLDGSHPSDVVIVAHERVWNSDDDGCAGCLSASETHPCLGHGCQSWCRRHYVEHARADWANWKRVGPLTVETITFDQIASLREHCSLVGDEGQVELCYVAMNLTKSRTGVTQDQAKQVCCDIINALPPEMFP